MAATVVITGASSGIGRALALEYAATGAVLGLLGRDPDRLMAVSETCRARGATTETGAIDVRDTDQLATWLRAFDQRQTVDLLIVNAGVLTGTDAQGASEPLASALRTIDVNLKGAIATADALVGPMRQRRSGQIALISSLAGLLPQPDLPAYSASKAALVSYGTSLRQKLRGSGVAVSVVCPGYVESSMTRRQVGAKPFFWTAEKAARHIRRRLVRQPAMIAFPWPLVMGIRLMTLAPQPLYDRILGRFTAEVEPDAEGRRERTDG
ncbi:MAG TPA: SDR family NAD(P)-dependent oxidoreductase [Vineibacter sp.]|nr:SDR family NAD(P)-dependent oxidoreductase [Vineibacter sp.]